MIGDQSKRRLQFTRADFKITDSCHVLHGIDEETIPLAKLSMIACIYKEKDYDVKEKHYKGEATLK